MLILYTTDDGKSRIQLRSKDQTVWLTQREMAELFDVSTDNISLHLKNIFADGELEESSVIEESSVTAADGKNYQTKLYNLDAILAVGYPPSADSPTPSTLLLANCVTAGVTIQRNVLGHCRATGATFDAKSNCRGIPGSSNLGLMP